MKKKQKTTTDELKKEACKIARKYYEKEDLVHGMPHINRMLENFEKLKKENEKVFNNKCFVISILDAVEFSIVLHDIAKDMETSDKKHGQIAIEILNEDYSDFFQKIPNKQWVEYATKGHTDGEIIKKCKVPDSSKKICLALLLALDNIDAIGEIGVHRDLKDFRDKFNWFSDKNKGDESFLERLLKNYCRINGNVSRVEKIGSKIKIKVLLGLYEKLKKQQEKYICRLIKEKKLKITDSEIKKVLTSYKASETN